ncbi:MAG: 2-dehydropantoate 2-reductase [Clostridiales bacterium]|nr:2-dehydropantoate 2-reductase [Clostridiales bacterium]
MKYLIIGSGGTGGSIGAMLTLNKEDVTFISRGKNLEALKRDGLSYHSGIKGNHTITVKVCSEDEYDDNPDVIFVCVKGYSISSVLPIIKKAALEHTLIIPIMNGYNMSEKISSQITVGHVLEGCIYISAFVEQPGTIVQLGPLFKVVFGKKPSQLIDDSKLIELRDVLSDCGIDTYLSEYIQRDTYKKYTFISAYAACGAYYDIEAIVMQEDTAARKTFIKLCEEMNILGHTLNINLDDDSVTANLNVLASLTPDTTASMQKDMKAGRKTEIDGLVFEVVKLAKQHDISLPTYEKIADYFRYDN